MEYSSGHIDNADYTKGFLQFTSDYVAPLKYWIFGGSKTRTSLTIGDEDYKLYAQTLPTKRNDLNIDFNVNVDGDYDEFIYNTGAAIKTMQISDAASHPSDNMLQGWLSVKTLLDKFYLGGNLDMDLHSVRGIGADFMQANAFGTYQADNFSFNLNGGFQLARNTNGVSRGGFLFSADAEFRLNELFTIKTSIESGLEKSSFYDFMIRNPYLSDTAVVDYAYNIALIKAIIYYHVSERFGMSAGINYRITDRMPMYVGADTGTFNVSYQKVSIAEISCEGFWQASLADELVLNFTYTSSALESNSKQMPYMAPIKLSFIYNRKWMDNFSTNIGLTYIGDRYVDLENTRSLKGYADAHLKINYYFNKELSVFVKADNLLNSTIFIWDGYKERSIYFSAGLVWQF